MADTGDGTGGHRGTVLPCHMTRKNRPPVSLCLCDPCPRNGLFYEYSVNRYAGSR